MLEATIFYTGDTEPDIHCPPHSFGDLVRESHSSTRVGTRDSTIVLEVVLVVLDYYR